MRNLCVILWDQLSHNIASLKNFDLKQDQVVMLELHEDCTYVKHHPKKLAFILSCMRHFAKELSAQKKTLIYQSLDAPNNSGHLVQELEKIIKAAKPKKIIFTWPGEFRVLSNLFKLADKLPIDCEFREDERFLASRKSFNTWANERKELRMEFFYRLMRRQLNILMDGEEPIGGQWNYDQSNRKFPNTKLQLPKPFVQEADQISLEVIELVSKHFGQHFGDVLPFHLAVTREQALSALNQFIKERLIAFGDYQDAMIENEPLMYHSHLSFYINIGLLESRECIQAAEDAYRKNLAPLNAVEGFIRQLLGWREYIRGVYWLKMPKYKEVNFFKAKRALPELYWGKPTKMNCLKQCVKETKQNAYAHHIQRLMILGNFALIAGIAPKEVQEWYLIVYADAYEWVELPNVLGMILYADGGVLASKPYAAGGSYINKMSNYCKNCEYQVKLKTGPKACPFNYLYWDFLHRNQAKLAQNQRLRMVNASLAKMDDEKLQAIQESAKQFFIALAKGEA